MRLLTSGLPGTGGLIKSVPEDFVVEELPAYPPAGEGGHTFLYLEKRGLTTDDAVTQLCRALGVRREDAGVAGQKDRQALTRQWVSVPGDVEEKARALSFTGEAGGPPRERGTFVLEPLKVLQIAKHPHKLRTGHLLGNRFRITIRGTSEGEARARATVAELERRGMPNYFGQQRFGARGDNAQRGRALVKGELKRGMGRGERRLLVSAYQSERFNRYLDARIDDDLLSTALVGDVMKKTDTGGLFTVDDVADAQQRLAARALVVTGPMVGHKMMAPPPGTPSAAREQAVWDEDGLGPQAMATLGKLAEGTRRPLMVPLGGPSVRAGDEPDAVVLEFILPPGAYATVLLQEVMKLPV
jgi:tRNA pseudouridine13 synthase